MGRRLDVRLSSHPSLAILVITNLLPAATFNVQATPVTQQHLPTKPHSATAPPPIHPHQPPSLRSVVLFPLLFPRQVPLRADLQTHFLEQTLLQSLLVQVLHRRLVLLLRVMQRRLLLGPVDCFWDWLLLFCKG